MPFTRQQYLNRRPWTPYQGATTPPAGTYDPSLDAALGQVSRGVIDTAVDTQRDVGRIGEDFTYANEGQQQQRDWSLADLMRQQSRLGEDYNLNIGDLRRSRDRGYEDLGLGRDRTLEDLLRSRDRGYQDFDTSEGRSREDYGTATANLQRQYNALGRRQAGNARAAHVLSGGILGGANAARQANQGREQEGLDRQLSRTVEDIGTGRTRLGEDYTRGTERTNQDYTRGSNRLGEDFQSSSDRLGIGMRRGTEDINTATDRTNAGYDYWLRGATTARDRGIADSRTGLERAQREGWQFGLDTEEQKRSQAAGMGWEAPQRPSNEFRTPTGTSYRVVRRHGQTYYQTPDGRESRTRPR